MAIKYAPGATKARETALGWVGRKYPPGWCLKFQVTNIFKVPGVGDWDGDRAADAEDYWKAAKARGRVVETSNPDKIPAGVMVMWTDPGRNDYGHAAYSLGDGWMVSTDLPNSGRVGRVKISEAGRRWGHKLVGYVLVDGNGFTLTPKPPTTAPPTPDTVRWFEARFLNVKGDDDKGAASFNARAEPMVDDLTRSGGWPGAGVPEVVAVCELRDAQAKILTPLMREAGYDRAHTYAGNGLYLLKGTEVAYRGNYWLPKKVQGEGRREALLRCRAKVAGHWLHIGVGHLDYRPGPKFDQLRVDQARAIADAMERFGTRFGLEAAHRHLVAIDDNSQAWVRDKGFGPAGYAPAVKAGLDGIYTGKARPVTMATTIATKSDHPIVSATFGKAR